MHPVPESSLRQLLESQRALEAQTATLGGSPGAVLVVGEAVLAFASLEASALFPLLPLLDPAVKTELADEHERLADDLQLLRWLVANTPDSPDVAELTGALARRMREHIARDGRLLAQASRLGERTGEGQPPE